MSGTAETLPTEDVEKFRKDALGIAQKMIGIIQNMTPEFEETEKSIENSDDYKKYVEELKTNPKICNKYKGGEEKT